MKTAKELEKLSNAIGKAVLAYHDAIFDNLKESGKECDVQGDDEEEKGVRIDIHGRHGDLVNILVDKVRFQPNDSIGVIEIHLAQEDYKEQDYWLDANYIGSDDIDYIYDAIVWDC